MAKWSEGYVRVPKVLLLSPGITANVLKTLVAVMAYAYAGKVYCWPSHRALAQVTGFSRRTVVSHIAILVKQGFLEKKVRPGHTDVYTIVLKKFSPDLRKSVVEALPHLHPLLKRKTSNREWQVLIKHDKILRRSGR